MEVEDGPQSGQDGIPTRSMGTISDGIAIIGLGCRFAESPTPERFWENLAAGRRMSGEIPAGRFDWDLYGLSKDEAYCRWGSFLEDVDRFDPLFFGISPREAELIDPQLRLFLEVFHETIEDAAQAAGIRGTRTGLYLGVCSQDYYQNILLETTRRRQPLTTPSLGNLPFTIANRTSYLFDLRGPSFCVDTACSSSLIALHLACEAIRRGECEMAVAGGVNLILNPFYHAGLCRMDALTHSGASRAFDAAADGYLRGEGVAALLLKPLERALADGDRIHAVIRGSHTNHGGRASSFTAPRTELQSELLAETWRRAGIDPATLGLLEAHGTGTRLGDPIEVDAAVKAFRRYTDQRGFCALGTVKANIGHGEAVAGLAGVVKAVLSLKHRLLPAMPDFQTLNPYINLADSPLYINTAPQPWPSRDGQPRRAGVSSFGIGGAYAHVVLEEAPDVPALPLETPVAALPVPFSAKTPEQLRALLGRFADFLGDAGRDGIRLVDVARTLQLGRAAHTHRVAFVAADLDELRGQIAAFLNGTAVDGRTSFTGIVREAPPEPALPAGDDAATLAGLWVAGYRIDWLTGPAARQGRIVSLPATPFADERYWFGNRPGAVPLEATPGRGLKATPTSRPCPELSTPPEPVRETLLFEPVWQPKPLTANTGPDSGGAALLLGGGEALHAILAPLMPVQIIGPGAADFDPASEADYRRIVAPFKGGAGPLYVFFDGDAFAGDSLGAAPRALLLLVRAVLAELPRRDIRLTYHGRADSGDAPRHAWATGFLGAARLEHPPLAFRWVLFAGTLPEPAALAEWLWREWAREASTEPCCRYVGGQRQVRSLRECPPPAASFPYRAGAAVLVTGGLGGLGLVFARHLARKHGATVIVAGRSADTPEAQAACATARAEGLALHPLRMDVADAESVRAGIAWIKAQFGALHGVIHSAGVLRDGLLFSKTPDDVEAVFTPKAHGAEWLDAATAAEPLDFFVLCGSLAGLEGNPGQSDYAAANAYLDAFAHRRAALVRQGLRYGRSLAIDWPYWAEGGMRLPAVVERMMETQGLYALPTEAGLTALDRALALDGAQIAVFHGLPERVRVLAGAASELTRPQRQSTDEGRSGFSPPLNEVGQRDRTEVRPTAVPRSVVLEKLLPVVAGVLNMPPQRLDPDEPLERYGLDSLLITTLNAALEQAFGALPKTLFFEVRTLSALADWLAAHRPERFRG
ncbi:MAG: SDR family NAD(P)-dependent oxidoreductase, partial [Methylomagnum sp.]